MATALALIQQAQAHFDAGRRAQAKAVMLDAAARFPDDAEVLFGAAQLLHTLGEAADAKPLIERLGRIVPAHPEVSMLAAQIEVALGDLERGEQHVMRALALEPNSPERLRSAAWITHRRTRYLDAAEYARRGLALAPRDADLRQKEAVALQALGRAEASAAAYREAIAACPDSIELAEGYASCLNYTPGATPAQMLEAHRRFGTLLARAHTGRSTARLVTPTDRARPPRIGILSADLRSHSVGFFMRALLEHHDHAAMPMFCYVPTRAEDDFSKTLRGFLPEGRWRSLPGQTDAQVADAVRADRVDILIELAGLTRDHRLRVMQHRPAPVQMTYCGYPNTTGVPALSHRLVDSFTDPAPEADRWCTEQLVRLDPSFLCYAPPPAAPGVPPRPPRAGDGPVVFGSFNALMKVNDQLLRTWAALLRRVPDSRLLIKAFGLQDPQVYDDVRSRVVAAGVAPERFELLAPAKATKDHLDTYNRVDIALDTFPYHGTTTTCEAMWMGVPVVTRAGVTHGSRVGVSLLTNIGTSELIARDEEDYLAIAAGLAADGARRAALHATLRAKLAASPLCDGPGFAKRFAEAMSAVWKG